MRLFLFVVTSLVCSVSCSDDCSLGEDAPAGCRFDPLEAQIQCDAVIPTFYFDKNAGECIAYTYGGCNDTPYEPFSTLEACQACRCSQ